MRNISVVDLRSFESPYDYRGLPRAATQTSAAAANRTPNSTWKKNTKKQLPV